MSADTAPCPPPVHVDPDAAIATCEPYLRYWSRRLASGRCSPEDLAQEGRIFLWQALSKWHPDMGIPLWAFAGRIVRLQMGARAKHWARLPIVNFDSEEDAERAAFVAADKEEGIAQAERRQLIDRMMSALEVLPSLEREAFVGAALGTESLAALGARIGPNPKRGRLRADLAYERAQTSLQHAVAPSNG